MIPPRKREEVIHYLLNLEKPSGGFAFAKTVPSGIEDTYFAIHALDTLGFYKDHSSTRQWLSREKWDPDPTGRVLYYRITLYKRLELEVPWDRVTVEIEKAIPGIRGNPRKLDFFGRILGLAQKAGITWSFLEDVLFTEAKKVDLNISSKDTLESLWRKVKVATIYGKRLEQAEFLGFIAACYNPDGGYGCKPHTTSFLEHIYFAYRILGTLGYPPKNPANTMAFVTNCQSKKGGFARAPGGVPFIDTTFYALLVLHTLEDRALGAAKGGEKHAEPIPH